MFKVLGAKLETLKAAKLAVRSKDGLTAVGPDRVRTASHKLHLGEGWDRFDVHFKERLRGTEYMNIMLRFFLSTLSSAFQDCTEP